MKFNRLEKKMIMERGEDWIKGLKQQALLFSQQALKEGERYVTRQGSLVEVLDVLDAFVLVRFEDGFTRKVSIKRSKTWYAYDQSFLNCVDSKTRTRFEVKKLRKEKQKLLNSSLSDAQKEIQVKLLDRLIFNLWNQQNRYGN